jgi:hypothetical protein
MLSPNSSAISRKKIPRGDETSVCIEIRQISLLVYLRKKSTTVLDTISHLCLNTTYAGVDSDPGTSNARFRADTLLLVLLTLLIPSDN